METIETPVETEVRTAPNPRARFVRTVVQFLGGYLTTIPPILIAADLPEGAKDDVASIAGVSMLAGLLICAAMNSWDKARGET